MKQEAMDFQVRIGRPDDYPVIIDIQRRAYKLKEAPLYGDAIPPLQETPESLAVEISQGKRLLLGEIDGRIVASLRMKTLESGAVYFGRLSVDPDFQGKGIGQRMTLAVEEINPDVREFILDCGDNSVENFHIYSKLGYCLTGKSTQVANSPKCLEMVKKK